MRARGPRLVVLPRLELGSDDYQSPALTICAIEHNSLLESWTGFEPA